MEKEEECRELKYSLRLNLLHQLYFAFPITSLTMFGTGILNLRSTAVLNSINFMIVNHKIIPLIRLYTMSVKWKEFSTCANKDFADY